MSSAASKKIRLATVWLSGCSGCHMSFLDLDEKLLELHEHIQLVHGPLVDRKDFPSDVDLVLVEGAVNNEDQLEMAALLRKGSRVVVALGDCAVMGNVPAMRNGFHAGNLLEAVYAPEGEKEPPGRDSRGEVPMLLPAALPLHAVIPVDVFLPGCPPDARTIGAALTSLLKGERVVLGEGMCRFG